MVESEARSMSLPVGGSGVVVLAFHRVVERPERDHDISWDAFRSLLDRVDRSRLTVSLEDDPSTLIGVPVAMTFDDATADHLDVAVELHRRGMRGVFFVPPAKLGKPSSLDIDQLRSIASLSHVVGAHGMNHIPLDGLTQEDLAKEVQDSKSRLEDLLERSVDLFAPPGGVSPPQLAAELKRCGYIAARSMNWGTYRSPGERWRIPCLPVTAFTLRRRWLIDTMHTGRMPIGMRVTWRAKEIMPLGLRTTVRSAIHRPTRRQETRDQGQTRED